MDSFEVLPSPSSSELGLIGILAIVPTLLAFACYVLALSCIEVTKAAAFIFLIPVGTLLLGPTILGESLTVGQIIFSGLIIAGVLLSESEKTMKIGNETSH